MTTNSNDSQVIVKIFSRSRTNLTYTLLMFRENETEFSEKFLISQEEAEDLIPSFKEKVGYYTSYLSIQNLKDEQIKKLAERVLPDVKFKIIKKEPKGFDSFLMIYSRIEPYKSLSFVVSMNEAIKLIPEFKLDEEYSISLDLLYKADDNSSKELIKNSSELIKLSLDSPEKRILCTNGYVYDIYSVGDLECAYRPCEYTGDSLVINKISGLFSNNSSSGIIAVSN